MHSPTNVMQLQIESLQNERTEHFIVIVLYLFAYLPSFSLNRWTLGELNSHLIEVWKHQHCLSNYKVHQRCNKFSGRKLILLEVDTYSVCKLGECAKSRIAFL